MPLVSGDRHVEGSVSRNLVGSNGDVLGVRPFRRGDSPRRIHWGQSARHDRLIVRELQANTRPVVQLVLDADPAVHAGHGPDSSREWAIRIVASLAKGWLAAGVEVGAAWNGQVIPAASGSKQLHTLLDALAGLPDTPGTPLRETLNVAACRRFADGLQVMVTTDVGVTGTPTPLHSDVAALAHAWADGQPRGWPQIAAVVQHLRGEYTHDLAAHTPEDCEDPLAYFLLDARRGPDYQFASAAAVLLRVLGYPTRLVSGFYVAPEHYDPLTQHTPVVNEDLHFWAEVMLPSGDWLVIEPTPGYDVLGPNLPWSERALAALAAAGWWLWEHVLAVSLCSVGLVFVCWRRAELLDAFAVLVFRLFLARRGSAL